MYEGFLAFGGNEIINSARAVGYAESAGCDIDWLVMPPCEGLPEALDETLPYTYTNIAEAPWYDDQDAASHRFLGVHGVLIEGITDSTRTADVAEAVGDGGVVSRPRFATRRTRVEAMLTAQGEDALEYGLSWLNAALLPRQCSVHGATCGSADCNFFIACPPTRAEVIAPTPVWDPTVTTLNTNPAMEATAAGTVELRRNLASNPNFETDVAGWLASGTTLARSATGAHGGGWSGQVTNVAANAATGDIRLVGSSATTFPAGFAAGGTYTVSAWINLPAANTTDSTIATSRQRRILFFYSLDGVAFVQSFGPQGANVTGAQRLSYTFTVPAGATGCIVGVGCAGSSTDPSFVTYVDDVLIEAVGDLGTYFDGTTAAAGDFTYAWVGTANASQSVQRGVDVADVVAPTAGQAVRWSTTDTTRGVRTARHRLIAVAVGIPAMTSSVSLVTGTTYTLIGKVRARTRDQVFAPRIRSAAGPTFLAPKDVWTEFRVTIAAGNGAPNQTGLLITTGSGHQSGDIVDLDDVLVVEGSYSGDYFDGSFADVVASTPPVAGEVIVDYGWTGAAHASTSTKRTGLIADLPDPVAYDLEIDRLSRHMHTVTAVSGPTIVQKWHRGEMWGYLVEFVLVSGVPWTFGVTKKVTTTPTFPSVVQDTPFNLVPYPSAELAAGSVVAATNYSDNPSVELDATNWQRLVSGAVVIGDVNGARSTESAVIGGASFKVRFVASNTASTGEIIAQNQSANFPAAVAGQRMSVNMWATAAVESGTAVIAKTEIIAIWRTGTTVLRTDVIGTIPGNTGALTGKSLAVPATATHVLMRARVTLTSWSTGAIVNLYADAVAVTVP